MKIIILSFIFSESLFFMIVILCHPHKDDILPLSFCFSGLGGIITLIYYLIKWKIEDKQIEEDNQFGVYREYDK
jgi:lipid-A-disaccharide synthase-like uncharacterized protein